MSDKSKRVFRLRRGLDLPLSGRPQQQIEAGPAVRQVALLGPEYVGMRPTMEVREGDSVKAGQLLFTDKKTPGVRYTSPGCGTVRAIHRGEKRAFLSCVIDLEGDAAVRFDDTAEDRLATLPREEVQERLVESGLWTAFRTRPYGRIPRLETVPDALFVTAIDTHPLAADPALVLDEHWREFANGLKVLRRLTDGPVYLCTAPSAELPAVEGVTRATFDGPHPAGLAGTHIHLLHPVNVRRTVWHIGYQDVIAIGHLFVTGHLWLERVISLAGPCVRQPRLLRTRLGASVADLTAGQLHEGPSRIVSGSVLAGTTAEGPLAFLGRYHLQLSVIPDGGERIFLGWTLPGANRFSINRTFLSRYLPPRLYPFSTLVGGGHRAIVPVGSFEKVMPLDFEPVYLLRALACGDSEAAQDLGCLELVEEDLALCTFVCNGKNDYGVMLRETLTRIEKEG